MLVAFVLTAVPADAQPLIPPLTSENRWQIPSEAEPRIARRGIEMPVITYTAPDGSLKLKRGIVAGISVAPNANIGIGLFETLPKKKQRLTASDDPMERKQRRSRKAAVGFSLKF